MMRFEKVGDEQSYWYPGILQIDRQSVAVFILLVIFLIIRGAVEHLFII